MSSKLGPLCHSVPGRVRALNSLNTCRYISNMLIDPATDSRLRAQRAKKRHREKFEQERELQMKQFNLHKFQTREWKSGDVYSPRDLSGAEMRRWKKKLAPQTDIFDALSMNPLHQYKNFAIMSEYVSETGRIKPGTETGLRPVNQRKLAKAVRRAVSLGLMPSVHRHPEILMLENKL
ncbi:hypothetical protein FQN57_002723 [Myotisia sp. PD_48]|nr:hypothetical protein FQN57_002723 [Myotisia sp. PD_48]